MTFIVKSRSIGRLSFVLSAALVCFAPAAWSAAPDCAAAKQTYSSNCVMCHQANGKGFAALHTVDFTDRQWQAAHKDSELISAIENGVKDTAMPSFKAKLTSQQIDDILHCVVRQFGK